MTFILVHGNTAYFLHTKHDYTQLHELTERSFRACHLSQAQHKIDSMNVLDGDADGWSLYG